MKSRPRRAEREVALLLSDFFVSHNLSPVTRIPVLGRTGPDLTINESGLVVDVKSRESCPITTFKAVEETGKARINDYIALRLDMLESAFVNMEGMYVPMRFSKTVHDWLMHMDEWREENTPWGISGIVLHRPNLPYGKAVLIIPLSDVGLLRQRVLEPDVIGRGETFLRLVDNDTISVHTPSREAHIKLSEDNLSTLYQWACRRCQ